MKKPIKKLKLRRETLRTLTKRELDLPVGGIADHPTNAPDTCPLVFGAE
jgi:hypothetical protein